MIVLSIGSSGGLDGRVTSLSISFAVVVVVVNGDVNDESFAQV